MKLIGNNDDKKYEIGNFSEELNQRAKKIFINPKKNIEEKIESSNDLMFVTDKKLFDEINKYIDKRFPDLENILKFKNKTMVGSNPYLVVATDMYLKSIDFEYRVARQADLEQNLDFVKGYKVDTGLALRNLTDINSISANYLYKQLKFWGFSEKVLPLCINLRDLNLTKHEDFNFHLGEAKFKTTPCLNWQKPTKYSKVNSWGFPEEENQSGKRIVWPEKNALSRCYLSDEGLHTDESNFSIYDDESRIVLAKVKGRKGDR